MLSPQTLVETLIHRVAPVWHHWNGREAALVDSAAAFLRRPDIADPSSYRAEIASLWILDRLVPVENRAFFDPLLQSRWSDLARAVAIYAWGRRLRDGDRARLFALDFGAGWPDGIAAEAAWCESCPAADPGQLLEWWSLLVKHGHEPTDGTLVVKEYARRTADRLARRQRLLDLAREGNAETAWDAAGRPAGGHLWGAVREALVQAACDLAGSFVPSMEPMPAEEKLLDWFYGTLDEGGFHEVVATCKEAAVLQKGRFSVKRLASLFWVERADWRRLVESFADVEERHPYAAIQRLGKCVPPDRLDAWEDVVRFPMRGNYPIQEFCDWLRPEFRDLLPPFFADVDEPERATCAYHAYLQKTPRPVLERFWARRGSHALAAWQVMALDRFLHAPPALRPPATVQDVQCVEADIRLLDPMNRRGM
ncbi:MAG TPA: hypothetical protein VHF22_13805 [Planctomycetota bacterium]|nr:hypothetical protein [Planctomycetota bacterium]